MVRGKRTRVQGLHMILKKELRLLWARSGVESRTVYQVRGKLLLWNVHNVAAWTQCLQTDGMTLLNWSILHLEIRVRLACRSWIREGQLEKQSKRQLYFRREILKAQPRTEILRTENILWIQKLCRKDSWPSWYSQGVEKKSVKSDSQVSV